MSGSYADLFTFVMEADEIPDFDPGADADSADVPTEEPPAETTQSADDTPPEMSETDDSMDFNSDDMGEENTSADDGGDEAQADDDNTEGEDIGVKTNNIMNERLYRKLTNRNNKIESLTEQITRVMSVLPYSAVTELDKPLNQLKTALLKGQSYAIDNFINAEYGANLLFFEKLNSAYVIIEDTIDRILKKYAKK